MPSDGMIHDPAWNLWLARSAWVIGAMIVMEPVAFLTHKYLMHGPGWGWHRSHHEPRSERFEKNDRFTLGFAGLTLLLFVLGAFVWPTVWWIGLGVSIYGMLYFLVHDVIIHQRLAGIRIPRSGYLKRLVQAHRLHHAADRLDSISFGFLYAPPIAVLKDRLRAKRESA